jgi:mannose-6-phosphate isomerase
MLEPISLEPVFKYRIWGGSKLNQLFGYDIPSPHTGECWGISAHPNGQSTVKNGKFAGLTLGELWSSRPDLFQSDSDAFPLLIKILDASDDLSVQVHPDDLFAGHHENGERGKTECWFVLESEPGAEIIFGHRATSKEELAHMIANGEWEHLLCKVQVKPGDFFYVPSGTIHALGKGIVVLETQQSSDTTYRVYDYERTDAEGNLRELHLDKAIEVTNIPHHSPALQYNTVSQDDAELTTLVSNEFFTVQKWIVYGKVKLQSNPKFVNATVISGNGQLTADGKSYSLRKGDHFILPAGFGSYELSGQIQIIVSWE